MKSTLTLANSLELPISPIPLVLSHCEAIVKLAYVTDFDLEGFDPYRCPPEKAGHWGHCDRVAKLFSDRTIGIEYIGNLSPTFALFAKLKRRFYRYARCNYHLWAEPSVNRELARQIGRQLRRSSCDVAFVSDLNLLAYLDCPQPKAIWTDTLYAGLIDFYPDFSYLCRESRRHLQLLDRRALQNCDAVILASDWAAKMAIETYGIDNAKISVVPFGANLQNEPTPEAVKTQISRRDREICHLLFVGVNWQRKGGDVALAVAKRLNEWGVKTQLTIVGCEPPLEAKNLPYVECVGFLRKSVPDEVLILEKLLGRSHFTIVPSRAECYGQVFCEASAFGVPSLSTDVGGIPTVIQGDRNGTTFPIDAPIERYCDYILSTLTTFECYEQLALSSYEEYRTRLSWSVAGERVEAILADLASGWTSERQASAT